jgi:hypothetical protein
VLFHHKNKGKHYKHTHKRRKTPITKFKPKLMFFLQRRLGVAAGWMACSARNAPIRCLAP